MNITNKFLLSNSAVLNCRSILIFLCILALYSTSDGQEKKITVMGKTIDATTGDSIPNVIILFADDISNISKIMDGDLISALQNFQFAMSDGSGEFSKEISVKQNSLLLIGICVKVNYQLEVNPVPLLTDTINFGTIKMRKEEFRTIQVSGTVKDSSSGQPISGAFVILTNTTISLDSTFHALTTDDQGKFSKAMKIGKGGYLSPFIIYSVRKPGYNSIRKWVPSNEEDKFDLGTIYISKTATSIKNFSTTGNILSKSSFFRIYSINGRLLYSGPELNSMQLRKKGIVSSVSPVIIYKYPYSNSERKLYNLIQ